jgi:hypothetical protein
MMKGTFQVAGPMCSNLWSQIPFRDSSETLSTTSGSQQAQLPSGGSDENLAFTSG